MKSALARKKIAAALERASQLRGVSVDDLEETSIPTYGLDAGGSRRQRVGEHDAEIHLQSPRSFAVRWHKGSRLPTSHLPAALGKNPPTVWIALQRELKEMNGLLTAQRWRLERFLLQPRVWPLDAWQQRYLNHPLVGIVARALIWEFSAAGKPKTAIWHDGRLVDASGRALGQPSNETKVTLWHPLTSSAKEVLAWRCWLEEFLVAQPFRQAFREVYRPAGKELKGTSSDRFAGHLLKQHHFAALARERGWRYQLQGTFDSFNTPSLAIPGAGWTAEFDVSTSRDEDFSDNGIYLHVGTRQVRFRNQRRQPMPVTEVPAHVFSEVMRDVDLFVSITSVGTDPDWPGRKAQGKRAEAWRRYALGELTATAEARRDLLERLLPRLELKASLRGKFLVVQGQLRAYKIHLGSGHVLMEPNDEFLSFPKSSAQDKPATFGKLLVPFEDDTILLQIVQRAVLLASDKAIKSSALRDQVGQT